MEVTTNVVFQILNESKKRISVMQGGTRSGKTYNVLTWFIVKLLQEKGKTLNYLPFILTKHQRFRIKRLY